MLDQCSSLVTLDRWGNIIRAEGSEPGGDVGPCCRLPRDLARNGIEALDDFDMPPTTCTTDHAAGLTPEPISALDRPGSTTMIPRCHDFQAPTKIRQVVPMHSASPYLYTGWVSTAPGPSQFRQKWELRRVAFHRNGVCG